MGTVPSRQERDKRGLRCSISPSAHPNKAPRAGGFSSPAFLLSLPQRTSLGPPRTYLKVDPIGLNGIYFHVASSHGKIHSSLERFFPAGCHTGELRLKLVLCSPAAISPGPAHPAPLAAVQFKPSRALTAAGLRTSSPPRTCCPPPAPATGAAAAAAA